MREALNHLAQSLSGQVLIGQTILRSQLSRVAKININPLSDQARLLLWSATFEIRLLDGAERLPPATLPAPAATPKLGPDRPADDGVSPSPGGLGSGK